MKQIITLLILGFSSLTFAGQSAQRVDDKCQIAGCSGELCINQSPKEDDGLATTCEYKNYYECFKIPNCALNKASNTCGWDQSPRFLTCLKEKKAPNNVIQQYTGHSVIRILIQASNKR